MGVPDTLVGEEASTNSIDYATMLLEGARYQDEGDVIEALNAGVDPNSADGTGRTALHMASANGHSDIVGILLARANIEVNARNEELNTPLHWAALNGHTQVVEQLLEANANPSALNRYDRTPVDEAVQRGFEEIMNIINAAMAMRDTQSLSLDME